MWFRLVPQLAFVISMAHLPLGAQAGGEGLPPGMVNPGYEEPPAWFKNSFLDIRADVEEAREGGRRVILYFYQDGCPYCRKLLRKNFADPKIVEQMRKGFDVVAINLWGDREVIDLSGEETTEKEFTKSLRVMFTPTMLFLDEEGGIALRLNGYYPPHQFAAALGYVAGRQESQTSFAEFEAARRPPVGSGRLHRDPAFLAPPLSLTAAARATGRPLLVLFEQQYCPSCDELHSDILRRGPVRELLGRFDVALVDRWSREPVGTPSGELRPAREWARVLNIQYAPSLVFFDASGQEVFRTEAELKAFHIESALAYVASGQFRTQRQFQRFIQARADALEAQGIHVEILD